MPRFLLQWRRVGTGEYWKVWAQYETKEQAQDSANALNLFLSAAEFRVILA